MTPGTRIPGLQPVLALALACAATAAGAQPAPPPATLVPAQSEIVFTTRQMGVPVEGRFTRFGASVALDPRHADGGSVAFTIDTGSARFGSPELDGEVGKPTWFNVPAFAEAGFRSTAVRADGPGRFEVTGRLTIKGTTHAVVVPVRITQAGGLSTARGSFTIRRLDYRIGEAEWADTALLADEVAVRFKLTLRGLGPL